VTALRRRGKTLRLSGEKRYVLQGVTADAFLVAARDGRGVSAGRTARWLCAASVTIAATTTNNGMMKGGFIAAEL